MAAVPGGRFAVRKDSHPNFNHERYGRSDQYCGYYGCPFRGRFAIVTCQPDRRGILIARRHPAHHGTSSATVSIHVRDLAQLFNSLDPSPFWDRDLDREAAEFIEEEFSEKRSSRTWHLHVHASGGETLAADLQVAIEHYYERLASSARRRLRDQTRFGQLALLGGIVIFLASMTARTILASALPAGAPRMLDEGLIVLAWLALWRPAESLVYGWVPLYRMRRLYERLAAIRVSVRIEANQPPGSRPAITHPGDRADIAPSASNVPVSSPRPTAGDPGAPRSS